MRWFPPLMFCFVNLCCALPHASAEKWPPVELDAATLAIEQALADHTTLEFIETPLQDVVAYLKDLHGIEIQIDQRALDDVGIGSDTPITRAVRGIALRSALRLMLRDLDLAFVIRDEVLLITTEEETATLLVLRAYNVKPLLGEESTAEDLIEAVTAMLPEAKRGLVGIKSFRGLLLVRADQRQQSLIAEMLGTIATGLDVAPEKPTVVDDPPEPMVRRRAPAVRPRPVRAPKDAGPDPFGPGGDDPFDPFGGGVAEPGDPFG